MLLEAEIDALKSRFVKPSGLRQLYEGQLRELNRIAEQMRVQRVSEHQLRVMLNLTVNVGDSLCGCSCLL